MTNYNLFAKFYDQAMGNRENTAEQINQFIKAVNPQAKTLLELGCGTGGVLKHLAKNYQVSGLDLSDGMLTIAKKQLTKVNFYHQSMVDFKITEHFDVIICIFDSINHLTKWNDWKKVFKNAHHHLTDNGIFIFDINTKKKLDRVITQSAGVIPSGDNTIIMNVTEAGKGISNWNVKIFEHQTKNIYHLHEENIQETAFPRDQILEALKPLFKSIKVIDLDKNNPKKKAERFHFICKK
jgi:SAM-dependent methyltransferase